MFDDERLESHVASYIENDRIILADEMKDGSIALSSEERLIRLIRNLDR